MKTLTFVAKDQNWADESTTYWFDVDGEMYGVVESCGESTIVDCDGCPDNADVNIIKALDGAVTDEMRMDF